MAEFCLKCFNEMNDTHYTEQDVILDEDLCEGCAEWKPCVVGFRSAHWCGLFSLPLAIIGGVFHLLKWLVLKLWHKVKK